MSMDNNNLPNDTGFPDGFLWGAASAAYQIEGAFDTDGKGPGIWDVLYQGNTIRNENGHVACDHYHRYQEDIGYMKQIGLKTYRFSVSWPRVIPNGTGKISQQGLDFYIDLVAELRAADIEPIVTLFHWDLPYSLHCRGGWTNDNIPTWFAEYTRVVVQALGDQVTYWVTLNEPQCFIGLGYEAGSKAPFYKEKPALVAATRNALMAHGKAVQAIRKYSKRIPKIGIAPCGPIFMPQDGSDEAIQYAENKTFYEPASSFDVSWFCDAPLLGTFPQQVCEYLGVKQVLSAQDMETVHQKLDFLGFNVYNASESNPQKGYEGTAYQGCPRTTMEWTIDPDVIYWAVRFLSKRYDLPVLITENGMSNTDFIMLDGKVHDPQRIDFVHRYLIALRKAIAEGYPVLGYTYWSIMDNYEWAEGYDKRFGLIYVDYQTQKRTLKDSALWYRDVIASNGGIL